MEMCTSASPFEANLTLEPRNSFRDVSFSSYLNNAEENMIHKITKDHRRKKSEEDEEIGVFGAEKYFMEDGDVKNDRRLVDVDPAMEEERIEGFDHVKQRSEQTDIHTPSVRSNASANSRSGLLSRTKQASGKIEKGSRTRIFLASFGCNCIKSTQISEKKFIHAKEISKPHAKIFDFDQRIDPLSSKFLEKNTRNDYFTFPVLNSNDSNSNSSLNSRSGNLAGKLQGDNNGGRSSLGRKLSMLNGWNVEIPPEDDEMYITSIGTYHNDNDSDSSSDLFEIESFSTAGNSSFLPHRTSESNGYAPSEVSIDWSVVTASAADFSVASDYEEVRTGGGGGGGGGGWRNSGRKTQVTVTVTDQRDEEKKRPGMLSGCTNHKAVRVSGDEYSYKVSGGGGPGRRRRWLSESMAVRSMFRGVNDATRFDPNRGSYGSDVYPMSESKRRHASQLLYVQQ